MADITLRLIWYRLGESSSSLYSLLNTIVFIRDAGGPILNTFFVCWLLLGIFIFILSGIKAKRDLEYEARLGRDVLQNGCWRCQQQPAIPAAVSAVTPLLPDRQLHAAPQPGSERWVNDIIEWLHDQKATWTISLTEAMLSGLTERSHVCEVSI